MGTPSSPPPAAEPITVDLFMRLVVGSGLLGPVEVQAAVRDVPVDRLGDATCLADHLVKAGKLSRFQANKLLQGATVGLVLGPYHLLAPIGKGGMGTVFLARDSRSQGLVAVKVLPPKRARAEERTLARFRREMELCQRVCHPHLTQTFDSGNQGDVHYIVMEFIRGRNLARLVHEEGAVAVPRAARLFSEVALSLEHAHAQGLIHRDLKPSNIMIQTDDRAKVLDLGLALIQGEVGVDRTVVGGAGYVVGTLDYIAPEQAEDAVQVDARSDIYSLGCTLYYTLTKQPPFPGGVAIQKLLRHRCDEPPPVEELNPGVPAAFAAIVRKMMAKRKEDRFPDAARLRAALTPWCDRPVVVPDVPLPPPLNGELKLPAAAPEPPAAPPEPAPPPPAPEPAPAAAEEAKKKKKSARPGPAPAEAPPPAAADVPAPAPAPVPDWMTAPPPVEEPPAPKKRASGARPLPDDVRQKADEPARAPENQPTVLMPAPIASVVPGPEAAAPAAVPVPPDAPTPLPVPLRPGELPFWLDYLLPVGGSLLFLFLAWVVGLVLFLRR